MKLEACFTDLDKLIIRKIGLKLDNDTIYLIKTKLKKFNKGLESLEDFIKKEMYSNRLEYFILKLKSILLSIVNCFYGRDLQYSRTKVYGMDHFYIIDETGREESIAFAMLSRRARDRRALLGEAGNASRRIKLYGEGAAMKRFFDQAQVSACQTPDESWPLPSRDSNYNFWVR